MRFVEDLDVFSALNLQLPVPALLPAPHGPLHGPQQAQQRVIMLRAAASFPCL